MQLPMSCSRPRSLEGPSPLTGRMKQKPLLRLPRESRTLPMCGCVIAKKGHFSRYLLWVSCLSLWFLVLTRVGAMPCVAITSNCQLLKNSFLDVSIVQILVHRGVCWAFGFFITDARKIEKSATKTRPVCAQIFIHASTTHCYCGRGEDLDNT